MAQNMTLMLVIKSDISAAFPQFLMSKVGGAGTVSVCWGWRVVMPVWEGVLLPRYCVNNCLSTPDRSLRTDKWNNPTLF